MSRIIAPPEGDFLDARQIRDVNLGKTQAEINDLLSGAKVISIADKITNHSSGYAQAYITKYFCLISVFNFRLSDMQSYAIDRAMNLNLLGLPNSAIPFVSNPCYNGTTLSGELSVRNDGKQLIVRSYGTVDIYGMLIYPIAQ